jgi:SH3 domain-containing YSC84-like protein 1
MFRSSIIIGLCAAASMLAQEGTPDHRIRKAVDVIQDIMHTPDKSIPKGLFDHAKCMVIVPSMVKAAFVVGADYGHGLAVCRTSSRRWGAPAAITLGGGSFGFQLGGEATDVVLLFMTQRGVEHLLSDHFKIGGDASAAAGPVGRTAEASTDIALRTDILSWSRSRGLFAGVALDGTLVKHDHGEDRRLYGRDYSNKQILQGQVPVPQGAQMLDQTLDHYGV